ncbi:MAG: bifunctional phosphopantothenoylcysteine decarboxylase/phosphopantothenate--cysteine ligase CoaBC [Bacteroidales bacterium]|jgi:phosphopantothenoylcysteine decarboxylase/phosphopantothenate--cysteine ligase|nr:bifunctional phosphopantothenoylcysteine decarboxylase/phosphopantothenate--cysteine ligase CoaBC [Bacteroidales bacterium]
MDEAGGRLGGKRIVLGITGSIAAYKAALLARLLIKDGAEVQVVMTPASREFITPVTMSALTGRPVMSDFFDTGSGAWHSHVQMGQWADLLLIAPATASTIAKMATGVCDNLLITVYLSAKCPVMLAPAMDLDMYRHPATQKNINTLHSCGNIILEPDEGVLASGLQGKGRMQEPEQLCAAVCAFFGHSHALKGRKFLVTAGPTHERIDPVRFVGNYSSGKMGFAIAEALVEAGATVTLVCGPVTLNTPSLPEIHRQNVQTAAEMRDACTAIFPEMDGAVMCAAVADYRPAKPQPYKIPRTGQPLTLELTANDDIAAILGAMKRPTQLLAGFALETEHDVNRATEKLRRKNFDFIVLNSLDTADTVFGADTNKITIITPQSHTALPMKSKHDAARDIVAKIIELTNNSLPLSVRKEPN